MREAFGPVAAPLRAAEVVSWVDRVLAAVTTHSPQVILEELYRRAAMGARHTIYVLRLPEPHILTGTHVSRHRRSP